jgi:nucleoprotein TPR
MRTRARAASPAAVDVPYLATAFELPEDEIQTLLDAPTVELVNQFLASVSAKAQEFDEIKAEKLRVDVELENTVRTSETKVKAQKATLTKHAKEIEELRIKLKDAEGAREALSTELNQLKSSSSTSGAEVSTLRQRVETLEASNRDALALVESKSTEKDRLADELSEQHTKLLALRREVGQLEERNQSLENAASTQKFKEQSLQQEIDLLKRNNEWSSNELQTRSQEHAKFRKERNALISSLQRELEESNATVEALQRTETTLRQRLEDVQGKVDEAFARNATLMDDFAKKEQDFRTQIDSTKRLADLQAQNASTHKARLQDVQGQVDQIKDDAAEEIGKLQAEVETERSDKENAEQKIADLELEIERLEQQPRASIPGTPVRNGGLEPSTPGRFGSPAIPGSAQKIARNLSHTQLYSQYIETKEALTTEERRCSKLQEALDELIQEFETRAPELGELRQEQDRLAAVVLEYSQHLEESDKNREAAVKESQRWEGEATAAAREGNILRQQLRDLSTQIKILMVEAQSREQGLGEMSANERFEVERAARGELEDGALDELSSTGRLISERLVIFRSVAELQSRNEQLLRLTRELGDKMEGEEAREKERQSAADAAEVEELRQQVERYKDELQATATQISSYVKERDMFRRMLQHRGTLQPDADMQSMFGQSIMPSTPQRNGGMEPPTPRSKDLDDLNKVLKEQQVFFDQFRNESTTDRRMLKEQVDTLAREKGTLQADLARAQSQLTLAGERFEMLQSNFTALRNENNELQKRSQSLSENAARQDIRTQQVAEELVEARSLADSLRNENANGKAEKELWKRIESRLTEDNKSLLDERSRLNKLVADLQNLQNERELAESESRRRLQARIDTLETEVTNSKKKLESEIEDSRKAALRREYEENQSRTRIDDLVKSLGNVREELIAAKTTRDQLQGRVDEMKIELRSAEEKVNALQPRPTPRAEDGSDQSNGEEELSAEQRLSLEVSDLKRELEHAKSELDSAREQVEQYKSIAQSTEEELANFNETSVQYREETDRVAAENEARIKELEQRIEDLSEELSTSNNELSELRTKLEDSTRVLNEQKAISDAELARLNDDAERYAEEKKLYQEDLKAQAEIAQQAQQSYEDELLKHAEAAKSLQAVRNEYNELRTEVAGVRAEAEASKANLESAEESWADQKEQFEKELQDMKTRRSDVDAQNMLLHQQMEAFSSELKTLREGRLLPYAEDGERAGSPPAGDETGSLQEVIKYLRREKEIVDVQYELSIQEAKRLQQQLDYSNGQLEDVRQKLAEERRQSSDRVANEGSTNKLLQTINELNLYRESSTTLRNEARQAREKLDEKIQEVERLAAEIEPLKSRVGELEGELESKDGEMKLLQNDRDHWRERTQNIISKYDRVDPAELEDIRQQLASLKEEKVRLQAECEDRITATKDEAAAVLADRLAKYKEQAKGQNRIQNSRLLEEKALVVTLRTELESVKAELEQTKAERDDSVAKAEAAGQEQRQITERGEENAQLQITERGEEDAQLQARLDEAETQASNHASRAESLAAEAQTLQARVQELEGQVANLQSELETAKTNAATSSQDEGEINESAVDSEALEKLREELATAQREVETLRSDALANAQGDTAMVNAEPAAGEKSVSEQVAEEVERLRVDMESQHQVSIKQMEEKCEKKITSMKANLQRQLKDEREKMREELTSEIRQQMVSEHEVEVQKLKDDQAAAIESLKNAHKAELERLSKEGSAAVQQAQSKEQANVKPETPSSEQAQTSGGLPDIDDAQAIELLKSNSKLRAIFTSNVKKSVAKDTEALTSQIAEKDAEISRLTTELESARATVASLAGGSGDAPQANTAEIDELRKKIENAKKEREAAVKQAVDQTEMKTKLQLSQRDMAQAKIAVITKAATETPDKGVGEVWEIAKHAKPAPKATPATPKPAATAPAAPASAAPAIAQPQLGLDSEQAKLQARQARFAGSTGPSDGPASASPTTGVFGQSSGPAQTMQAPNGGFGQSSQSPYNQQGQPSFGQRPTSGQHNQSFGQSNQSFGQPNQSFGQPNQSFGQPNQSFGQPNQSFGQPSQGSFGQASPGFSNMSNMQQQQQQGGRQSFTQGGAGTPPNPNAPAFAPPGGGPAAQNNNNRPAFGTGPAALRGLSSGIPAPGSRLPRGGSSNIGAPSGIGRGGAQAGQGLHIQGAANAGGRGGQSGGLPRGGGSAIGRGRGGGRGGPAGPGNAGMKRGLDGAPGGGDEKRMRPGGGGAGPSG